MQMVTHCYSKIFTHALVDNYENMSMTKSIDLLPVVLHYMSYNMEKMSCIAFNLKQLHSRCACSFLNSTLQCTTELMLTQDIGAEILFLLQIVSFRIYTRISVWPQI